MVGEDKTKKRIRGIENSDLKKELGEICVYCGCSNLLTLTIDHKKPTARGGKDIKKNKHVTCFLCNQLKGALTHDEFLEYYEALQVLKKLNKLKFEMAEPTLLFSQHAYPRSIKDMRIK